VGVAVAVGVGVAVAVGDAPGVAVAVGVGDAFGDDRDEDFSWSEELEVELFFVEPPNSEVRPPWPLTEPPIASSDAVTTLAAITKASSPVAMPIFHHGRRCGARSPNGSSAETPRTGSSTRSSGTGSKSCGWSSAEPCGRPRTGTATRWRTAVTFGATAETFWTGRRSASATTATMTGVIAVAITVPLAQNNGTMVAAATADTAEISSVWIWRPPLDESDFSRLTPLVLASRARLALMELIHTCYRIGEIDRSVAFYEALGFEERRRMQIRDEAINVFMGVPGDGDRLELTYNFGVDSYELGTGYNHIALTVDDLDGTLAGLAEQGIEPEKPPYSLREGGSRICFVRDPDGYRIEMIERAGA
jgi:lactoylglutathione lyase